MGRGRGRDVRITHLVNEHNTGVAINLRNPACFMGALRALFLKKGPIGLAGFRRRSDCRGFGGDLYGAIRPYTGLLLLSADLIGASGF